MTEHELSEVGLIRVAQYVRKSTDHQKYSIENQSVANHAYAATRGMEIVRTYADAGKSGLTFARRAALKQLISDVQNARADFTAILVYDVSRWGRFQDADESGYYEYICKRAGIKIHYCAEQFDNDGSPFSAIVKSIKRAMAAEYSRELSVKSFVGQSRIFRLGFRAGGSAVYGMRRLLVDESGNPKQLLRPRQYKNLNTDRVVLVLGPPEEIRIVRWIFSVFTKGGKSEREIVRSLNDRGIYSGLDRPWTYARVHGILKNEIFLGCAIWNRTSIKLGKRKVRNSPDSWLRVQHDFAPVVDLKRFETAQAIIRERGYRPSNYELLERLRQLYAKHGYLDTRLIERSKNVVSPTVLYERFGGLRKVHKLIGSKGRPGTNYGISDEELLAALRQLLEKKGCLSEELIEKTKGFPSADLYFRHFGSLLRAYAMIGYVPTPGSHQGLYARTHALSKDQMLDSLRALLLKRGHLSERLIDDNGETPSTPTFIRHFGSLSGTYKLIGYVPSSGSCQGSWLRTHALSKEQMLDGLRALLRKKGYLSRRLIDNNGETPTSATYRKRFGSVTRAYSIIGYTQQRPGVHPAKAK